MGRAVSTAVLAALFVVVFGERTRLRTRVDFRLRVARKTWSIRAVFSPVLPALRPTLTRSLGLVLASTSGAAPLVDAAETTLTDGVVMKENWLDPGKSATYSYDASNCDGFLHVELWDRVRLTPGYDENSFKADPMLLVRNGAVPTASFNDADNDWKYGPAPASDTYVDEDGHKLLRSYHHVSVDMRDCSVRCDEKYPNAGDAQSKLRCIGDCDGPKRALPYKILVMNVDRWFKLRLQYDVKATCFAKNAPPCPRPGSLDGDVCGGQGTCINATLDNGAYDADATTGVCTCNAGYGDVGCNERLALLSSGTPATGTTGIGDWSYYEFEVVLPQQYDATAKVAMLAELRRESGDPVLFVKKIPRTGAVPSVSDYAQFADTEGFRTRVNYHSILLSDAKPGKYYIAVFNNNVYIQQEAKYDVEVTVALPGKPGVLPPDPPLCRAGCNAPARGECKPSGGSAVGAISVASLVGVCECKSGYGGDMCEGVVIFSTVNGGTAAGILDPGEWAYVKFDIDNVAAGKGLTIKFSHEGGHPIVLMKKSKIDNGQIDEWPSLLDNTYLLSTTEELGREATWRISSAELQGAGSYVLGVFNMQYYRDSSCKWHVTLESDHTDDDMMPPSFMSVVLVIIMAMFMCLLLSVCKWMLQGHVLRRMRGREDNVIWNQNGGGRAAQQTGCPREIIDAIPQLAYTEADWNASKWAGEDPSCSVCIEQFEDGDVIKTMPTCQHVFHKECIDEWLAQHSTCPNCRASLLTLPATPAPSAAADPPEGLQFLFGRRGPRQNSPSGTQVAPTNDVETSAHGQSTNGEFVRVRGPPTDVEMAVRDPEEDRQQVR